MEQITIKELRKVKGVGQKTIKQIREQIKQDSQPTASNTHKIIIPGELPGLNKIIDKSKQHWASYSKMKKKYTNKAAWIATSGLHKMNKIDLHFIWYCKNRRKDKDNILVGQKFIIDGLVEAGVIENDGWKQIGKIEHSFEVDKENPRVEVKIKEVER